MRLQNIFSFQEQPPKVAYLDPCFCINILIEGAKFHTECFEYAEKLEVEKTILLLSNLGLDEIWFALLRINAIEVLKNKGIVEADRKWFWFLKDNPQIVMELTKSIEENTLLLLEIPKLILVEITEQQTLHALILMKEFGLMPRDAIHGASAKLSGAGAIITTDKDFNRIKEINIYTCNT
ncbi:MAG: PIN domain-containing protein [Nitrospirota bacterium]